MPTENDMKAITQISQSLDMSSEMILKIVTIFERIVGFNSPSISQKDLLTKVSNSVMGYML